MLYSFRDVISLLMNARRVSLKGLFALLLILIREQPFSSINTLPINLLILTEWEVTY